MDASEGITPGNGLVKILKEYGLIGLVGCVGLVLVGYGLWLAVKPDEPVVEIVESQSSDLSLTQGSELKKLYVDVGGAVEKPGVYTLPAGSRIGDALAVAGGLAAEADRAYVSRTLNLAQEVKDGGKIYIPARNAVPPSGGISAPLRDDKSGLKSVPDLSNSAININTASQSQLETLWGIGSARAQGIIANRPYGATEEIISKAKIPQSVYDKIKDQISVY